MKQVMLGTYVECSTLAGVLVRGRGDPTCTSAGAAGYPQVRVQAHRAVGKPWILLLVSRFLAEK